MQFRINKKIINSLIFSLYMNTQGASANYYFSPEMLENINSKNDNVDLSLFGKSAILPGVHEVNVNVNGKNLGSMKVEFRLNNDLSENVLQPCIDIEMLAMFGVQTKYLNSLNENRDSCTNLKSIPDATASFNVNSLILNITLPQRILYKSVKGYIPSEHYDEGINALLMNYNINGAHNFSEKSASQGNNQIFANLRPGFNLGAWRFRNYTTWGNSSQDSQWNTIYNYVQRDITSIKSQILFGDGSSSSDIFDGIPFRGVQLSSDEGMLPDSLRGYAPIVRGIARTNAEVVIRQNGYIVYTDFVSPGSFEISDIYSLGSGGDLNVMIKEADGSEQHFIVPYASLPLLQREGQLKYNITSGQYRSYDNSVEKSYFSQLAGVYGLPLGITAFGGFQVSEPYYSMAIGVGGNILNVGAISSDIISAHSKKKDGSITDGQSLRVRYSKSFPNTGTYFAIAGYRYSTDGFYNMQEVFDTYRDTWHQPFDNRRRNRAEMTLSQKLWSNNGSLNLSVVNEDYWNSDIISRSLGVGYFNNYKSVSYSLNLSQTSNQYNARGNTVSLSISLPISWKRKNISVNYNALTDNNQSTQSIALGGSVLDDNNLNWGIQQGIAHNSENNVTNASANYKGKYGQVSAGLATSKQLKRMNYSLQGGVVAHSNGITLGQPLNETIALIETKGISDVKINNYTGLKTDYRGYAIVPYVTPYRKNDISIDVASSGNNIEFKDTIITMIPNRGAIVKGSYRANKGARSLMTLSTAKGFVPFGATVSQLSENEFNDSIVGDQGVVYLTGLEKSGKLHVKWGVGTQSQCYVDYVLSESNLKAGIYSLSSECK